MAEKRPDQLPAITGMSDNDIFIIQQNINDPTITNRTVGQISKKDVGFVAVSGGAIRGPLNVLGDVLVSGDLTPAQSGTSNLGSSAKPWGTGYFTAGTIELGNICLKGGADGLIIENGHGIGGNVSGNSGIFSELVVGGEPVVPDASTEQIIIYGAASGESHKDLAFSQTHSTLPMLMGNMVLENSCTNFYALSFTNLTLTGCRVLYSSAMQETGNSAHILVKKI